MARGWGPKGRRGWEEEVDEELEFHLEMRRESYRRQGLSQEDAERETQRRFGPVEPIRRDCVDVDRRAEVRRMWGSVWSGVGLDLKVAIRQFVRRPMYVVTVVATFALAVGGNTAAFSLLNSIVLRPAPFEGGDRLVRVWRAPQEGMLISPSAELTSRWRNSDRVFEVLGTLQLSQRLFMDGGDPTTIGTAGITPELLDVVGARPIAGRLLGTADTRPGAGPVALVSDRLWRTRLGSDPEVVGRTLRLGGEPFTVVGVLGPDARRLFASNALGRTEVDVWIPAPETATGDLVDVGTALGILREGIARERAEEELNALARMAVEDGLEPVDWPVRLSTQEALSTTPLAQTLWVVFACVLMVLVIACMNIGGVQIARGIERREEFAVRSAIGASRAGMVRQLATEGVLLSAAGAAVGLAVAVWALPALASSLGSELPELRSVRLDPWVLAFALAATGGTSLASGVVPGVLISRRSGGARGQRGRTATRGDVRIGRVLVAGEVTLTIVLLVVAGLFLTSHRNLRQVDPGFDPEQLILLGMTPDEGRYPEPADRAALYEALAERIAAVPGVATVSTAAGSPDRLPGYYGVLVAEEDWGEARGQPTVLGANWVEPDYFQAIGAQIVHGRLPDADAAVPEVVLSRSAARTWFGEEAPLGRRFALWTPFAPDEAPEWRQVVGVTEAVRPGIVNDPGPQIYLPLAPGNDRVTFLVRVEGSPSTLLPALRRVAWDIDERIPVESWSLMADRVRASLLRQTVTANLTAALGAIALLIAVVGVYGAVILDGDRRIREHAIRMALGANPVDLRRRMLRTSMAPVVAGLALGTVAALTVTGLVASLLWGVSPRDPVVFLTAPVLLACAALLASMAPARRVLRIDPARTLTEG